MITAPKITEYLANKAPTPHPVLIEMEQLAAQNEFPILGPLVCRFLVTQIRLGHVHKILECGSGFGYGALWMALALPENGKVVCIEYDQENITQAQDFLTRAGVMHKVEFIRGDVLSVVPSLRPTFDMIVNDIDKEQYPIVLPQLLEKLRTGGLLITDNMLWSGRVVDPAEDEATASIQKYTQMLIEHPQLWTSILPLRDGVALSVKLERKN